MTWTPTNTTSEWGHIRVTVGRRDVTFFRDIPTVVNGWQDTDPYGSNNATLTFPQVTEFEVPGEGELDWLYEGAPARIDHVNDGAIVENLWIGFIDRLELGEEVTARCAGQLMGRLALRMHQPPIIRQDAKDAGRMVFAATDADTVAHYELLPQGGIETGIDLATRGSRDMTKLGYLDHLLGLAVKPNGDSLTILPDTAEGPRTYRMQWRDTTGVDATVYAGAHGVKPRLSRDLVDSPNRIYGEWIKPSGERCRGAVYPNLNAKTVPDYPFADGRSFGLGTTDAMTDTGSGITVMARELMGNNLLDYDDAVGTAGAAEYDDDIVEAVEELQRQAGVAVTGEITPALWDILYLSGFEQQSFAQAHFRPIALDKRTDYFLRGPDGTPFDINPNHDSSIVEVEQFISYGEGMKSKQVRRNGRAIINRQAGWSGTVTLTSDPAEMSRFSLRAGMMLNVRNLKGAGATGINLYISSVQVDWPGQSVTLAVSTDGRHYLDLLARKERNREAKQDPGAHWRHQLRRSARTSDVVIGWEGESGAGIIHPTPLAAGHWNVIPVIACEGGTASRIRLATDAPTPYYAAMFAAKVNGDSLDARLGDPSVWVDEDSQTDVFTHNADWLVEDERLLVAAWGTPDEPCGHWPKRHTNNLGEPTAHPVTGVHRDDSTFEFWTERNFLWLAVWPEATTTISGRMRIVINEAT